jgi:YVTN family beta-propeller protein
VALEEVIAVYRSLHSRLAFLLLFLTASLSTVFAQHIVARVAVGDEPRGVAINPYTGLVYVANVHDGTISILRTASVLETLPVDTLPYVVAINYKTNRIYAAGCNFLTGAGSMVVVIDGRSNQVITDISLNQSCGLGTQGIAVNQFTDQVYVSDYDDNQEVVIDGATNQIAARIDLLGRDPLGVAVDLLTNQIWVALDGPVGNVDILDGATNTILNTITVGNVFVNNVAINPATRRAYISSDSTPSNLYVLDSRTRQVVATVPAGQFANEVTLDPLSNLIFVTDGGGNQVFVVNGQSNAVTATVPLNGIEPSGIAVDPVTQSVYVSEFDSNQVEIMSER